MDRVYAKAVERGVEILLPPKNEDYGQRCFLTLDSNGLQTHAIGLRMYTGP